MQLTRKVSVNYCTRSGKYKLAILYLFNANKVDYYLIDKL